MDNNKTVYGDATKIYKNNVSRLFENEEDSNLLKSSIRELNTTYNNDYDLKANSQSSKKYLVLLIKQLKNNSEETYAKAVGLEVDGNSIDTFNNDFSYGRRKFIY